MLSPVVAHRRRWSLAAARVPRFGQMAPMTPMMAAIAAAKRSEAERKKTATAPARDYEPGEKVQYWSDSVNRWVDAVVRRREDKDGAVCYALDVKKSAPAARLRPRPADSGQSKTEPPPTLASSFASFDDFGGSQARSGSKRGLEVDDDVDEEQRRRRTGGMGPERPPEGQDVSLPAIDWSDPPRELEIPREEIGGGSSQAWIEHVIRFFVGAWRRECAAGFQGRSDAERAAFKEEALRDIEEVMAPLFRQLATGEDLERGEKQGDKIRRSGARTACDGMSVGEYNVLGELEKMASLAIQREYVEAQKAYMRLALGNKRWNQTLVTHVSANTMSGAREYRRNRDDLNTYDVDPVARRYMQGLRKLVQFAQLIRPNDDQSKNIVL